VNEIIDGASVSITYCPLTGSVIGYEGNVGNHSNNTYGTSGKLFNSNLVMYDRATDSYIPQILGEAVNNELEGNKLRTRPVHWADWIDAKTAYPDAKVLSLATGHSRDYFRDPYGSYNPDAASSYYTDGDPMLKVMNENDGTFSNKKVVIGIKSGAGRLAVDPDIIKDAGFFEFKIDGKKGVAFYDEGLKAVRVFYSTLDDSELSFSISDGIISDNRGVRWNIRGISDKSETLNPMTHFDVMWFAWYAYYPDTAILK
jgi:hypothetical protein